MKSSEYINEQRREYSLYTLQMRAIPAITDGLKAAQRRVLWTARDGRKYKSATLAGATMPIHPHASPEGAINTLAAPYGNNIPLLRGDGAFGTLLNPTAYGAARYTSVSISQFTKDVVFADMELVPMQENYDGTQQEPKHFLPLVPIVLVNPSEGIAVGFASTILSRDLTDIIQDQIKHLEGKIIDPKPPKFTPTKQYALRIEGTDNKWTFLGICKKVNTTTLNITSLPFGVEHEKYVEYLMKLEDAGSIVDFEDNSKDTYNITVKFKRGALSELSDEKIIELLKLRTTVSENMNVLDFDGHYILGASYAQIIEDFTDWRLFWFKTRYQRLAKLLAVDIQKYRDIILAIESNLGATARKVQSRSELKEYCSQIGIVHVDYIADLPIYRFTEDEKIKVEKKLSEAEKLMKKYELLLKDQKERVKVYINELQSILKKYRKGEYQEVL